MKTILLFGNTAPTIDTTDIYNQAIPSYQENTYTFVSFHRFAACPFCTLRTHELIKAYPKFKEKNIEIVSIWPSSQKNMLKFSEKQQAPFHLVSNPSKSLYKNFWVTRSSLLGWLRLMLTPKIMFSAMMQHLSIDIGIDADPLLYPAEFLIDQDGKIVFSHYGTDYGDHTPIEEILWYAE